MNPDEIKEDLNEAKVEIEQLIKRSKQQSRDIKRMQEALEELEDEIAEDEAKSISSEQAGV